MTPERTVASVLFGIGLVSAGVLAWAARELISLDRSLDVGDVVVLGVLLAFGAVCVFLGWRLFRSAGTVVSAPAEPQGAAAAPPRRVSLSRGCAAVGVVLVILAVLLPENWYPVVLLFVGLALLAVSHALTPCEERLQQLRKARDSTRQL